MIQTEKEMGRTGAYRVGKRKDYEYSPLYVGE